MDKSDISLPFHRSQIGLSSAPEESLSVLEFGSTSSGVPNSDNLDESAFVINAIDNAVRLYKNLADGWEPVFWDYSANHWKGL
jgi:hypothetical protein